MLYYILKYFIISFVCCFHLGCQHTTYMPSAHGPEEAFGFPRIVGADSRVLSSWC